jgi:hypothetical protein
MIDFLAKVVAELIFRVLVMVIGWFGTRPFVEDVSNALLERWERSGIVAAIQSALDAVPRALQSRVTWIAKSMASRATARNDLAAPLLTFVGGMYLAFDFAFWLAHLLAPTAIHGPGWLLQVVTFAIAALVVVAVAYVLRRLSMQIVALESVGLDWFILALTCAAVVQAGVRAYLSAGSWHAVWEMLLVMGDRTVLALAIAWLDAKREEARHDRHRRETLPSYYR